MNFKKTGKWKLAQKLEYKWWQRYLIDKKAEEYLQQKTQYWNKVLDMVLLNAPIKGNLTVLDAGCGPAGVFIALDDNYKVVAIDPLLNRYRGLQHFKEQRFPWVQFRNLPIELLDEKEKFDVIYCMNAINHVSDIEICYDNLVRALKPGGYLIVSTDAHRYKILKKIFQFLCVDMLHPIQLDIKEYAQFLTKRGVIILKDILFKKGNIFNYYVTVSQKR